VRLPTTALSWKSIGGRITGVGRVCKINTSPEGWHDEPFRKTHNLVEIGEAHAAVDSTL